MNPNKLTIGTSPLVSHQFIALPLSVIFSEPDNVNIQNWFYNNFTQIYSIEYTDKTVINYYNYGSLDTYDPLKDTRITQNTLDLNDDIIDFYRMCIDNEYYIYTMCDDYFIRSVDLTEHRLHDILIYGYDDCKKCFNICIYPSGQKRTIEADYADIIKACNSSNYTGLGNITPLTVLYKKKSDTYSLEKEKLKWHLLDYLESVDTLVREAPSAWKDPNYAWGMDVYDCLTAALSERRIGLNSVYVFYEHKKHLLNKILYFSNNTEISVSNEIKDMLRQNCEKAQCVVNAYLKQQYILEKGLQSKYTLDNSIKTIEEIRSQEQKALYQFLEMNEHAF